MKSCFWAEAFCLMLCAAAFGGAVTPAVGVERQVLKNHAIPMAATAAQPIGKLAAMDRLDLAIGLPWRNREALTNLLADLYNPGSPRFRQYLTPEQFAEQFGPTAADYQAVIAFAQTNGLTIAGTHPNRLLLDVNGTVADIERALHVSFLVYQHPTEARTFYAPDTQPTLDLGVSIQDISGLDNNILPRPMNLRRSLPAGLGDATPNYGSGANGAYMGRDFRAAYAPGVSLNGAGQAVGLLQFDGYYASDITQYESLAGLPNVTLQNVLLDNFNGSAGNNNVEVALDIEMTISMAPGLSRVIVYEAGPKGIGNDILNRMATDNLAKQLSSSWSFGGDSTTPQIFQQLAAQGQSFFNAAGDSDAWTGTIPAPCDDPYITIVGGTTLSTSGPGGVWTSEKVWNWGNGQGSGGGISTVWNIPSWQQGISMTANAGSTTKRNIPDVALTADNILVIANNGQQLSVGGTSCATPLWAGFMALVNQQAAAGGNPPIGFANPALYSMGKGTNYASAFHDITTGNNTSSTSPSLFPAVAGYDLCTGWGTPAGSNLINALAPMPVLAPAITNAGYVLLFESCSPTNGVVDPGETVTVSFVLRNDGLIGTGYLIATLQPSSAILSPSGSQAYGVLAPGGAAAGQPFTFTANGPCGSNIIATLQLQDSGTNLGTVSFTLPLGGAGSGASFAQNFDGVSTPALPNGWTTTVSGAGVNWTTVSTAADSSPNSAYVPDVANIGVSELVSPTIAIVSSSAQLTFRHSYNLEISSGNPPRTYDGGVLEIQIGNSGFTDILSAGGGFVTGGYNRTISTHSGNPLGGRQAWSGNSGGFITTTVNLPAAAAGQSIQLKWRCGTDSANSTTPDGWYIDSIAIQDTRSACCSDFADLAVTVSASPVPAVAGQSLDYILTVTNAGPQPAYGVAVTDVLPGNTAFVSASPGGSYSNGTVTYNLALLPSGSASNLVITVVPGAISALTNTATVSCITPDPDSANNAATIETAYAAATPPAVTLQPTNTVAVQGGNAGFQVAAGGSVPLSYQWTFYGTNLPGATSSSLVLTNVQAWQAGDYTAVVTNTAGSATSTPAHLTVLVPPMVSLNNLGVTATGVAVSLSSVTGLHYTLEYKNSLTDINWTAILPAAMGTGSTIVLQDTNQPPAPIRFYRVNCD